MSVQQLDPVLPLERPAPAAAAAAARRAVLRPELLAVLALSAVLNFWALSRNAWANEFYSAAVRSMSTSWHDFLYASFDPSGAMTVDKPPLALWVQALSARVFGFHPLSLLVPQALMGVASVALVYDLTRRVWGRPAGFVAGLVLATTPIAVAMSRHNNPDAMLVLCCTAGLWCIVRGLADGRTRWVVLAGVCLGLGFETKMAAALLILPALAFAWFWVPAHRQGRSVRQLLAGGGAMALVGGAWPALVALTPAASRPWMGGTADNSVWSLIFAYNGVGRLSGSAGGARGLADGGAAGFAATPMNAPGGTNAVFGGSVGPLRLLESSLGGQAGWLVGAALVGLVGLSLATGLRRGEERSRWVFAAGYSFLTVGVAFTAARGIFHPYYTSQLAPLTAALIGATAGRSLEGDRTGRILAAAAVAGGIASELVVLHHLPGPVDWTPALLVAGGIGAAGTALALRAGRRGLAGLAVVLGLLLAAPASWAFATLGHPTDGTFPAGGPAGAMPGGRPATIHSGARTIAWALDYARAHGGGTLAIASQSGAAPSIIASGADIAGLGGFSGQESRVTTGWVAGSVGSRQVRWVLGAGRRSPVPVPTPVRPGRVIVAVRQSCRRAAAIPLAVLYDCAGRAGALAAAG